ncbi:MAG: FAD-dependent oxidoreductase, partial [Opitutaceae bacterium]|nr:FAD-dependent oxidoreductase [Opitutaceae bacterium]
MKTKTSPFYNPSRLMVLFVFIICAAQWPLSAQDKDAVLQAADDGSSVFVEAEGFADKGGWVVDQQYMDQMGSPVVLAHGAGVPVADATTEVVFPKTGAYRVFVRTRNWVAKWTPQYAPGVFKLMVDGRELGTTFGNEGVEWHWQAGGTVEISSTKVRLSLRDLTGFDGRCDAILFSADPKFTPPDGELLAAFRRRALGLPGEPGIVPDAPEGPFDLVVGGGGMAGICTAISAARLGVKVALIQDRPVLGGNNSSEVRVHLQGRINYPPYENIGNLVGELDPMQTGSMLTGIAAEAEKYRDDKKLAAVLAEKNITLYLSTHVMAVEMGKNAPSGYDRPAIKAVVAKNIETGRELRFKAGLFADCTGDATLAYLAGTEWRMWPETKAETGEFTAPEKKIKQTMGASMPWNTKDTGRATTFPKLPWAVRFTDESSIKTDEGGIKEVTRGTWRWETGLDTDQVEKAEEIRDHLFRAVYGHWSYLKNQSPSKMREKVAGLDLDWVPFIAGKRESRRIMGDHILCEQDFDNRKTYDDGCVMTTWTIDLHVPTEHNAKHFPGEEFYTVAKHKKIKSYLVPYRCFYSRSVPNLFMAGRNISVTRVALGTIRVMRTTGMMGEVVGMAASICKKHNTTPRGVYREHLPELVGLMKKGVAEKPRKYGGGAAPQPAALNATKEPAWLKTAGKNLARDAQVSVSSIYPNKRYPAKNINDGRHDYNDNRTRWASAQQPGEHYAILKFSAPVTVNAARIISGEKPGINPNSDFVLQYKGPRGRDWIDIKETARKDNRQVDLGLEFP